MTPVSTAEFLRLLGLEPTHWQIRALDAWVNSRVIVIPDTYRTGGSQFDDLQKSVRWQPDTFPLSIEKHPTFVSIKDQFENIAASLNYLPTYDRSEIQQRCNRYWEALNAPRRWRWQESRPVRKLFQSRPVRTVIPGLGLTRRPAGRYYSGTRKAMNRKLAA